MFEDDNNNNNTHHRWSWPRVPVALESELRECSGGRPVLLMSDAEAWLAGYCYCASVAQRHQQAQNQEQEPKKELGNTLLLVFDARIACAYATRGGRRKEIELAANSSWPRLRKAAQYEHEPGQGSVVHRICGAPFFAWSQPQCDNGKWGPDDVRREFTLRVSALLGDVLEFLQHTLDCVVDSNDKCPQSIVLVGANAAHIDVDQLARRDDLRGFDGELIGPSNKVFRGASSSFDVDAVPLLGMAHQFENPTAVGGRRAASLMGCGFNLGNTFENGWN